MMAVGVAFLGALRPFRNRLWKPIGLGALGWFVSVALKFAWALPVNPFIYRGLLHAAGKAGQPLFWIYVGLLTGIFECGFALLLVWRTRLKEATWSEAYAFGTAFGAVEAIALGVVALLSVLVFLLFFDHVPAELRTAVSQQYQRQGLAVIPFPIIERAATVIIHIFSSLLIIHAVQTRRWRWFWLSFAYKSGIDAVAAWAQQTGMTMSISGIAQVEGIVVVYAALGLAGIYWLRSGFAAKPPAAQELGTIVYH
jgi:uncharacterized membrane protein YhfC